MLFDERDQSLALATERMAGFRRGAGGL